MQIFWVSLGCAKNLVSSEEMLYAARQAGHVFVDEPERADVAVVNTCGFIEAAKQEGIENILELAAFKPALKILVAGCMAERYREEIFAEMPEVDGLLGCGSFHELIPALEALERGEKPCLFGPLDAPLRETPRLRATPPYTAYLRIAEGCDNRCAYCVIPTLRGPYRSRSFEGLVREAEQLAAEGVRELIIIAQDITRYGLDLYDRRRLAELLRALCRVEGLAWIRLHYLYPDEINDELMSVIAQEDKIVKYLDIPIQHCNDRLLREMNRRGEKRDLAVLFAGLRARVPGLVLRTSLIVGFPGETEEDFTELCAFVEEQGFARAGVFAYSQEEGTPAAAREDQVDEAVREARREILGRITAGCMDVWQNGRAGQILETLVEGYDPYTAGDEEDGAPLSGLYFGRSYADSPEVDGKVFFSSGAPIRPGDFVRVRISHAEDGDLFGEAVI